MRALSSGLKESCPWLFIEWRSSRFFFFQSMAAAPWMPMSVHTVRKCVFVRRWMCLRFQAGRADNKWKRSSSTAVFNWSNRRKWARSCCPNNEALCRPSPSTGRSMWNNNYTPLWIYAPAFSTHLSKKAAALESQASNYHWKRLKSRRPFAHWSNRLSSRLIAIFNTGSARVRVKKVTTARVRHLPAWAGVSLAAWAQSSANTG